jgi:hypothetical protein
MAGKAPAVTGGRGGGLAAGRTAPASRGSFRLGLALPGLNDDRLALSVHESGHCVAGVIYGARLERAYLADGGARGSTEFSGASFQLAGPVMHRLRIASAGAVAEAMLMHGRRPTLAQVEARLCGSDREELHTEAMATLRPVRPAVDVLVPLLMRTWGAVSDLAGEIYGGRTVSHGDVCRALGLRDRDGGGLFRIREGW